MKTALLILAFFTSGLAFAQTYSEVKVSSDFNPAVRVESVKILETKVETAVDKWGNFENRSLRVTFGLEVYHGACQSVSEVKLMNVQSSLESSVNGSDLYYAVIAPGKKGCLAVGHAPHFIKFTKVFSIDQREASEAGKPWPAPLWLAKGGAITHFSFHESMKYGINYWKLYRLDITDLQNVKFEFKKSYAYVQGEVQ